MSVIVDTSIWSLALRRAKPSSSPEVALLTELIREGQVVMLGAIRQEVLSGIRHVEQFKRLKDYLGAFPDTPLEAQDYELAAELFNTCRRRGVQGSNTDFLICAASIRRGLRILTADGDFELFQSHIPISLVEAS